MKLAGILAMQRNNAVSPQDPFAKWRFGHQRAMSRIRIPPKLSMNPAGQLHGRS
jgi:hypothetical protein